MNAPASKPHVGVISDCALQRHMLAQALGKYQISVPISCGPELLAQQPEHKLADITCWILALDDEDTEFPAVDSLIEQADKTPVLFGLESAPNKQEEAYISWERRLYTKLAEYLGPLEKLDSTASLLSLGDQPSATTADVNDFQPDIKHTADEIWVLAASLGGPAAVKEFLDLLPASIKAGFYYAQHIDEQNSRVLTKVLGRHSKLDLIPAEEHQQLKHGEVIVVPVEHEISFENHQVNFKPNKWEGPYGPSIDHLLKNLFKQYAQKCNVVIFSGMGNDGAMLAPKMKEAGCEIWAQTPESCANGSMPQSIIDLECHTLTGNPTELAQAFIKRVGCYTQNDFKKIV